MAQATVRVEHQRGRGSRSRTVSKAPKGERSPGRDYFVPAPARAGTKTLLSRTKNTPAIPSRNIQGCQRCDPCRGRIGLTHSGTGILPGCRQSLMRRRRGNRTNTDKSAKRNRTEYLHIFRNPGRAWEQEHGDTMPAIPSFHRSRRIRAICIGCLIFLLPVAGAAAADVQISGRYPHLAMFNHDGECGSGAVVPWADRLWVITYSPHEPKGSDDKLYEIDELYQRVPRRESVGGAPADRLIHRESKPLIIG